MLNQDLVNEYLEEVYQNLTACDRFQDGQEFIIDENGLQEPFHILWTNLDNVQGHPTDEGFGTTSRPFWEREYNLLLCLKRPLALRGKRCNIPGGI
jgi:hypothetical protein